MSENEWLRRYLSKEEELRLEGLTISVTARRAIGMVTLLTAWRAHVLRIERELERPDSDRTVWGMYDLVAAYSLRSFIADGIDIYRLDPSSGYFRALNDADIVLKSFTEIDVAKIVRLIDEGGRPEDQWWWNLVPRIGPIRRELETVRPVK